MPEMDKTGPFGTGPIVRGAGPCDRGRAFKGHGAGFRWEGRIGRGFCQYPLPPDVEKELLEQRKGWLEAQIETINQRLKNLVESKDQE
ncbi:MAG TPA: DUF5320 domain-containing protein [Anaerolineaceae bacterium]|nr:DUF5320 domain-containing protein [Anaerolineaceae bacterium]